ncbi:Predicted metal-dependent phosphohydrolase, HD superfamily [Sanguibacter gelidistatuariae]|uniref:Predicted metal-dependent phosphohydrolase, HD superfamily n=1 Tax=Sanguibacter gelidistatuariae TaxID=1814289 RepID=A0A1G6PU86_9MICO|nr:hypothetical protein [Sanguibacter gelidistatuariae]SDC83234.1 Predicted metal-dependent phosphohydrolase, HD superfamily [Sanguibacter gelidistatuariae]
MPPVSADAPQWLLSSWIRSTQAAGATAPESEIRATGLSLLDRWSETGRIYHNVRHLADVLSRVDELAEEAHEADLVRLAAWYHGAVFSAASSAAYATQGGEDEVASAALARTELIELGVPERKADRVRDLVTALSRHKSLTNDEDCAVLCDADMGILAAEPQRYKAYLIDIRKEYEHIPVRDYIEARHRILTKLLSRKALYTSPLATGWEDAARQNLAGEVARLEKELSKLDVSSTPA